MAAANISDIRRPALRYHGGKWKLAPWIIGHFPPHRIYVEPFGGAASVLLRKPRSYAEVYNDLNSDVVRFFRVLRDPVAAAALNAKLRLTPFARDEFELSYEPCEDPVEAARRLLIRSFAGFGSTGLLNNRVTGFRSNSNRSGTTPAMDWANLPDAQLALVDRLKGVVIENRPAVDVMRQHDGAETLHYVDPPYVFETRSSVGAGRGYAHEMTDDDHRALLAFLGTLKGAVILSGYRCPLYDEGLQGWRRIDREHFADGARRRTESLSLNDRAAPHAADLFQGES